MNLTRRLRNAITTTLTGIALGATVFAKDASAQQSPYRTRVISTNDIAIIGNQCGTWREDTNKVYAYGQDYSSHQCTNMDPAVRPLLKPATVSVQNIDPESLLPATERRAEYFKSISRLVSSNDSPLSIYFTPEVEKFFTESFTHTINEKIEPVVCLQAITNGTDVYFTAGKDVPLAKSTDSTAQTLAQNPMKDCDGTGHRHNDYARGKSVAQNGKSLGDLSYLDKAAFVNWDIMNERNLIHCVIYTPKRAYCVWSPKTNDKDIELNRWLPVSNYASIKFAGHAQLEYGEKTPTFLASADTSANSPIPANGNNSGSLLGSIRTVYIPARPTRPTLEDEFLRQQRVKNHESSAIETHSMHN